MKMWLAALPLVTLAQVTACSGMDDGVSARESTTPSNEPAETTTEPKSEDPNPTAQDAGNDGATNPPPASDAGNKDAAPDAGPIDAFTGAGAYQSKSGPSTRKAAHPFTNDDPHGRACFDCHGSSATSFSFAGTVYANAAGTQRAANVEVRLLDKSGKALSAWTNADGNFFFILEPNGDLDFPSHAGIRNAKGKKVMQSITDSGDCNNCHKAGGAGRLVAP